jgi:hypothetical protein
MFTVGQLVLIGVTDRAETFHPSGEGVVTAEPYRAEAGPWLAIRVRVTSLSDAYGVEGDTARSSVGKVVLFIDDELQAAD